MLAVTIGLKLQHRFDICVWNYQTA